MFDQRHFSMPHDIKQEENDDTRNMGTLFLGYFGELLVAWRLEGAIQYFLGFIVHDFVYIIDKALEMQKQIYLCIELIFAYIFYALCLKKVASKPRTFLTAPSNEGGQSAVGSLIDHLIQSHPAYQEIEEKKK